MTDEQRQALIAANAPTRAPLDWHFIETLAQRLPAHTGGVHERLAHRLDLAIGQLQQRLDSESVPDARMQPPAPVQATPASPLAALLGEMGAPPMAPATAGTGRAPARHVAPAPRPELKSVGRMRKTLSRIKVKQQVSQALAQPPQHAGPIHSQKLVLRSLALMQAISPEYLHRFMSHVDALMTLEDAQRLPLAPVRNRKRPG